MGAFSTLPKTVQLRYRYRIVAYKENTIQSTFTGVCILDIRVAIGSWETPPAIGGPSVYIEELVNRLSQHVKVTLLVPKYSTMLSKDNLAVKKFATMNVPIIRVSLFSWRASNAVKKLGVDVVHDNGVLGFTDFSPLIENWHHSEKSPEKVPSSLYGWFAFYRERLTLQGLRKASSVIAISSTAKNDLIQTYGLADHKIHVVPHGVDTTFFKPQKLDEKSQQKTLLYVGALSDRKNVVGLIKALNIVEQKQKDVRLLIVGDGHQRNLLINLVKLLGLQNKTFFLGAVSKQRLLELYNLTDFTVLPSYKEGFGLTMLESLACEKPVIMTPVGISDIIQANNLGEVADGFEPSQIAQAILTGFDGKHKNLRKFVVENFTWEKSVEKTINVYKQSI